MVATVDRIVPTEEVIGAGITIPAHLVSAVAEVPFGAHPASCYPNYAYDREHLTTYLQAAQSGGDDLAKYLQQFVFDVDEAGYRELIGEHQLRRLADYGSSTQAWKELFVTSGEPT